MLFTLLAFVLALGLLITFHEYGHYWVARRVGVRVLRFSVGFGPILFSREDAHGTQWALSAIPLGGYVKMQDDPDNPEDPQQCRQAFNTQSLLRRTAIVAAGPAANLLLAAILYAFLAIGGVHEPRAILDQPPAGSVAALAGIQRDDVVLAVDSHPVASWPQVRWQLAEPMVSGGQISLHLQDKQGTRRSVVMPLAAHALDPQQGDPLQAVGLALRAPGVLLGDVQSDGAAAQAGLQSGDRVLSVGPLDDPSIQAFVAFIQAHPERTVPLVVDRAGTPVTLTITPQAVQRPDQPAQGRIGAMLQADRPMVLVRESPLQGLLTGVQRTLDTSWMTVRMLGRMVWGQVSIKNITGPVTIADYAGQSARIGLDAYLSFLALISISLGVLNLLPVPMLDGGHLLFYLIEALRGGRPLSAQAREWSHRLGLSLVLGLMTLALFNDFQRLFT